MEILPGSITDDTEMTLALLYSILDNQKYDRDSVIINYLNWANLQGTPLGKNTRALMKGVKTIKGFESRWLSSQPMDSNQSNGSLMRCFPLVILPNWKEILYIDTSLTNNNPVNCECTLIYLSYARYFLTGKEEDISITQSVINDAINDIRNKVIRNVSINKGWVVNALYVALLTLYSVNSFQEGMDFIATHFINGDTDTLMAITGGLLGARYGFSRISEEDKTKINLGKINNYFSTASRPYIINNNLINKLKLSF
jgi:ADP-ribosyl-[dinitrogen reductase] hydrolase